jgi:N-acyl-D-aspartate/D-glutamate deacylase
MKEPYDILIRDTTVVDGTGQPAFHGSVGVRGERITGVGDLGEAAAVTIEESGLVTCPGFVDPHSHADLTILSYPLAENLVMQGITTFVGGQCGLSLAPSREDTIGDVYDMLGHHRDSDLHFRWRSFEEWLSAVEALGLSLNYVPLVGHNTVRSTVMGKDFRRTATAHETEQMQELIEEALLSGAFGLSIGLDPSWPGHFADTDELVQVAQVAQKHGAVFAPHKRHQENQWPAEGPEDVRYGLYHGPIGELFVGRYHGLLEVLQIAREAMVRTHIAHLTPAYLLPQPHPPALDAAVARATLDIIDEARAEGLDVTFNLISWVQAIGRREQIIESFFSPRLLLPDWLRSMSREEFAQQLKEPSFRHKVRAIVHSGTFKFGMVHPLTDPYWFDCYKILECKSPQYVGRTLGEIARRRLPDRIVDWVYRESLEALFDILAEDPQATWALIIDKRELATHIFLQDPGGMPGVDVESYPGTVDWSESSYAGRAPMAYGLYPHYIRRFVKDLGLLSLEEAIYKATCLPASVYGLENRGTIQAGAYADLVLFNLDSIREGDDFMDPARPPEGIELVMVNGAAVWQARQHTGTKAGKVLRRKKPGG